jgi:hypothetical protein
MNTSWPRVLLATLTLLPLAHLSGCSSGGATTQQPTPPTPDFTLTVAAASTSLLPGATPAAFTATIVFVNGFSAAVALTITPPSGIVCQESPCAVTIAAGATSAVLHLAPSSTATPGAFSLTFTATSGTLTHTTTVTLTVAAPVALAACATVPATTPLAGTTSFVYTGNVTTLPFNTIPASIVYDPLHNLIFASNQANNAIDVISPNTQAIVSRIAIPLPQSLDISVDGQTLLVGTHTSYDYRIDLASLCITGSDLLSFSGISTSSVENTPIALAGGNTFLAIDQPDVYAAFGLRSSTGVVTQLTYPVAGYNYGFTHSGDCTHVYFTNSAGNLVRYDLTSGSFTTTNLAAEAIAVNQDGSRILAVNSSQYNSGSFSLYDASFNLLKTYQADSTSSGVIVSPDFSRLYIFESGNPSLGIPTIGLIVPGTQVEIVDTASMTLTGFLPSMLFAGQPLAFDGIDRVLGSSGQGGLSLLDLSAAPAASAEPYYYLAGVSPANSSAGLQTTLNGDGFTASPQVVFSQGASRSPASAVSAASTGSITVTAPSLPSGCADVSVSFPTGASAYLPLSYCYSPRVISVTQNAGPSTGGTTVIITGFGVNAGTPSVTIGGVPATGVTISPAFFSPNSLTLQPYSVTATVPPGPAGPADIVLTTAIGSVTIPHAFTYVDHQTVSLPAGSLPFQVIYDAPRDRLLWTDNALNKLIVFSIATNSIIQQIPTGPAPRGLALTPDGANIVLVTAGDRTLTVFNAATGSQVQQASIPTVAGAGSTPIYVAPIAGGKVLVDTDVDPNTNINSALYTYDLTANAFSPMILPSFAKPFLGGENDLTVTPDGQHAIVGGFIYNAATETFSPNQMGGGNSPIFQDVSSDGAIYADVNNSYDPNGYTQNLFVSSDATLGLGLALPGRGLNATGSLLYKTYPNSIATFDVFYGTLLNTVMLPETASLNATGPAGTGSFGLSHLTAIDPAGQRLWIITSAGLTTLHFDSDPLSVGEVQFSGASLTLLGSGFSAGTTLLVDATSVPLTITSTTSASATLPTLSSGPHFVTLTRPDGQTYIREYAFTTP